MKLQTNKETKEQYANLKCGDFTAVKDRKNKEIKYILYYKDVVVETFDNLHEFSNFMEPLRAIHLNIHTI